MVELNTDELYDLYNNSLYSILNPNMLSTLSDRKYNIYGFNLVNRILIYIQNKYATSLRSEVGWEAIGRRVKDKSSPISIIENIMTTTYIDPDTDEEVHETGLNPMELDQAIGIGAIKRVKEVIGIKCIQVYNIKDTDITDINLYKQYYKSSLRKVKLSTLLALASKKYAVNCIKSKSKSTFNLKTNTIEIGEDSFEDKIDAISIGIYHQLELDDTISDFKAEHGIDNKTIEVTLGILEKFICESIKSYCIQEYEVESSTFYDIESLDFKNERNIECFIQLMYNVYNLVEDILYAIRPKSTVFDDCTLKKAAELLNILEANEAYSRLRG